jgi:ribosomal protein S18 acetylase RimI-like enzyme
MNQTAQNHKAFFKLLATNKESIRQANCNAIFSVMAIKGAYPKLTLCSDFNAVDLSAYFKLVAQQEASPYIIIDKYNDDIQTKEMFKQNGFRPIDEWSSMTISLDAVDFSNHGKLYIEQVKNQDQLEKWLSIVEKTLFNSNSIDPNIFGELLKNENTTLLLGVHDNQPICTALSFIHKETVGLYMVSTLNEFRGHGFGKELIMKVLQHATEKKIKQAVLHATRNALSLYKKIGFKENGTSIIYWKVGRAYI